MPKSWPLNKAKTHLSKLVDQAQESPQLITRHGKAAAVVLSPQAYEALTSKHNAWEALRPKQPILGAREEFERLPIALNRVDFDE